MLLDSEKMHYLFSEAFLINVQELQFFIPELNLKNIKTNLKSLKNIVEFLALYRTKYRENYKLLTDAIADLIKVLENLNALLKNLSESSVKFIKKFQQFYKTFQDVALLKIMPFYTLKFKFMTGLIDYHHILIEQFDEIIGEDLGKYIKKPSRKNFKALQASFAD